MDKKLVELCKKYNVTLIEDAAESLGTTYKGEIYWYLW